MYNSTVKWQLDFLTSVMWCFDSTDTNYIVYVVKLYNYSLITLSEITEIVTYKICFQYHPLTHTPIHSPLPISLTTPPFIYLTPVWSTYLHVSSIQPSTLSTSNTDRHSNTQILFHKPFLYTLLLLHICLLSLLHCLPAHTISVPICTAHYIIIHLVCSSALSSTL